MKVARLVLAPSTNEAKFIVIFRRTEKVRKIMKNNDANFGSYNEEQWSKPPSHTRN